MIKIATMLVALSLITGGSSGCKLLLDTNVEKQAIQAPPLSVKEKATPIQPDEISASNAQSKAKQLLEEIENDSK